MRTSKTVQRMLHEWGIDISPLRPQQHAESVLSLPAPALRRPQKRRAISGEALRQILLSAREQAEKRLFYFDLDGQSFLASGDETARLAAAQSIEQARLEIHRAWTQLVQEIEHKLRRDELDEALSPALEHFYQSIHSATDVVSTQQMQSREEENLSEAASPSPFIEEAPKRKRGRPRKNEIEQGNSGKYPIHTSQEWLALLHTASDGHYQRHFSSDENRGVLRHQRPNAPFFTETALSDAEKRASFGLEMLRQAAQSLDLDDGFIWLYISDIIAPTQPLAKGNYAGGWVDLDDVARRTLGGYAPNPEEALRRRRKVWHALRYGARAVVGGERSTPYFDKTTGKTIDTRIHTTPWQIVSRQEPVQPSLFPDDEEEIPIRVELVASRAWTALTTASDTAQFLPMGEMLGAIPPNQPSGAWARSVGLAYFHWCRLHVKAALEGAMPPSRRELLEQFPSKTTSYEAVLASDDPGRALKYWKGAENYLRETGFIESPASTFKPPSRKGWKETWLEQSPDWKPGPQLRPILEALAANLFATAPRSLSTRKNAKRRTPSKDAAN